MNNVKCKPGDLAIVINHKSDWHGMIVEVISFAGDGHTNNGLEKDLWFVSKNGETGEGLAQYVKPDSWLLPIGRTNKIKQLERESESGN